MAQLPLNGVKVFLHIRDNTLSGTDRTRHQAKKTARQLGAKLTLSEATADMVVFHCGSESLLDNLTAQGRVVVSPAYLTACVKRTQRVAVEEFLLRSAHTKVGAVKPQRTVASKNKKNAHAEKSHIAATNAPKPHETVSPKKTAPFLSDETPRLASRETSTDRLPSKASVPYLDDDEDEEQNEIQETAKYPLVSSSILRGGAKAAAKATSRDTPYLLDEDEEAKSNTTPVPPNKGHAHPTNASLPRSATPREDGNTMTSHAGAVDTQPLLDEEESLANTSHNELALHETKPKTQSRAKTSSALRRKRLRSADTPRSASSIVSMAFTDARLLRPMFPTASSDADDSNTPAGWPTRRGAPRSPSALRIAVIGADLVAVQFLCDVVDQLGGTCVPRLFGRGRKPTHLVVSGRVDLSPALLMAHTLGIPVLTEQWIHDAIALGAFPTIMESHPYHCGGPPQATAACQRGDTQIASVPSAANLANGRSRGNMVDDIVHILDDDIGPHYRPIFLGMRFALISYGVKGVWESWFGELVRLLGGSISRRSGGEGLHAIIYIGQEMGDDLTVVKDNNSNNYYTKSKTPRRSNRVHTHVMDEALMETQPLDLLYPSLLTSVGTFGESEAPVISVKWLTQCILQGELLDMTPFQLAQNNNNNNNNSREEEEWKTNPSNHSKQDEKRSSQTNDTNKSHSHKDSVARPVVANPFIKTKAGPRSARKEADQQLTTQQLLTEDENVN